MKPNKEPISVTGSAQMKGAQTAYTYNAVRNQGFSYANTAKLG
jgi:hypothetical protein